MSNNIKSNKQTRKRGRPAGKNRVPLTAEQRRARNAQYERERREEYAAALAQLADAAGCDRNVSIPTLIETALKIIKGPMEEARRTRAELKRRNEELKTQRFNLEYDFYMEAIENWMDSSDPFEPPPLLDDDSWYPKIRRNA